MWPRGARVANEGGVRDFRLPVWPLCAATTMRRSLATFALGIAASLLAGCGNPTGPSSDGGGSAPSLRLDQTSVLLEALGDSAALTASLGGQSTRTPALSMRTEARYLTEAPVLDAAALARGVIRASAPGAATLEVTAFGSAPALVTVQVRPRRPAIVAVSAWAVGDGDTLRLRGYRMDALAAGSVTVGGTPVQRVGGDSATLLVTLPSLDAPDCSAGATRQPLQLQGADAAAGLEVLRRRRGDIKLAVGQALQLTPRAAHCLLLAPEAGARYALAFVDTRQTARAQSGFEGYLNGPARYTVTVRGDGAAARASSLAPSSSRSAAPERMRSSLSGAGAEPTDRDARVFARSTPWRVGDRFRAMDPQVDTLLTARVVAVYEGGLVLAAAEGQAADGGVDSWLARADSALRFFAAEGAGVYRRVITSNAPTTSAGSGQLLVLAARDNPAYLGFNESAEVNGRVHSVTHLNLATPLASSAGALRLISHEIAHAWQAQYAADTRPAGAPEWQTGATWSIEGTADLLGWWLVGRYLRIEPNSNWDWARAVEQPASAPYALLAASTRDNFSHGYASAASFCLDLATRMVREGATWDAALASVVRGSLDGWYGYSASGARREGLAARVRPLLGTGWEPGSALLTWTLSQAVDDASASEVFQNRAFLSASSGPNPTQGWGAPAVLRTGGTATRVNYGAVAEVWGNAASVSPVSSSPNYVLIDDGGQGGAYSLAAAWNGAPLPSVAWALVRYK